jgi:hypothetical protein
MRGLGAITAAAAQAQAIGTDKNVNAASKAAILASATALQMVDSSGQPAYIPGTAECAAASGTPGGAQTDMKLASTSAGLALTGLQLATTAGVVAAPLTLGISIAVSSIIGLFSTLINHHAQAVAKEQTTLCSAVPAANNYLNIIAQAVASGQASPQDGISALESLKGDFRSSVGSIYGDCNAACVMYMELEAICAVMESQFQDLISGAQQVVTAGGPNVTQPAGVVAPASSYSSFYSSSAAPSAPNTVAAPTTSVPSFTTAPAAAAAPGASGDWLPIAALGIAAFLVLRNI